MKRILIFAFPILLIISVVFIILGAVLVHNEEERLLDDIQRKARAVAEAMDLSANHILANNDLYSAQRLVEKFQTRERLQGCVIYKKNGDILAITARLADWKEKDKPYIAEVLAGREPRGAIEKFKQSTFYSYAMPILDDKEEALGLVEVIYDTSYVTTRMADLWRGISITLFILVSLIFLTVVFIQRQVFVVPIERLTEWFHHFQKGDTEAQHLIKPEGELGKLASEVEEVALKMRIARKNISEQAQARVTKEELWTEAKLRDVVQARLGENALFVVSNREPLINVIDEATGQPRVMRPASGLVTAIDPVLMACGGTWIAHGSGNADRKFVNSKNKLGVPPDNPRYILKRVWLSKEEEEGYYYGFSNEGLWPLCHITHNRPIFRQADWEMYREVNQKFAESVLEDLPAKDPFVFIQDYHFTLLPKMIKDKRPDANVALFWHIPWPNPEVFSICPYQKEILEGLLGCDLIGFHTQYHCNNFLDTVNRLMEARVDTEKFSVIRAGRETFVRAFPISVSGRLTGQAPPDRSQLAKLYEEYDLKDKIIALGVDRIDYTKGIPERILAIDRFLEKYPRYRKEFVFIQIGAPSRTHIKRYHDLIGEIDELVEKKNWKYKEGNWQPIIFLKRNFSPQEIEPFYELADLAIVSSLDDGMNLVAKEYVMAKKGSPGALVLSRFTGAARELSEATQINPHDIEDFADKIKQAIELSAEEKKARFAAMVATVSQNNIYRWAGNIITDLTSLKKTDQAQPEA